MRPISWQEHQLHLLDQRVLPNREELVVVDSIESCHQSIKDMVVRGAPCIGFTAIFGMALWIRENSASFDLNGLKKAAEFLISARPTAVNLEFEVNRCVGLIANLPESERAKKAYSTLVDFGLLQMEEAHQKNLQMAKFALEELQQTLGLKRKIRAMTHCNTGVLACGTLGTALGVISHLAQSNHIEKVWVDETRPYMQGTRLTSFELSREGIAHDIVVEGAASYLMSQGLVDAIFVGADRIVRNGDTANKVGTATLAIVANYYKVPFYVVAPVSSFDLNTETGKDIEIELRDQNEILQFKGQQVAPQGSTALNPSFDVTPSTLITGIICEKGVIRPGKGKSLVEIVRS